MYGSYGCGNKGLGRVDEDLRMERERVMKKLRVRERKVRFKRKMGRR